MKKLTIQYTMKISECLPHTSLHICNIHVQGIEFKIYQTKKYIYTTLNNGLYGMQYNHISLFNMRADIRRNAIEEFCVSILEEKEKSKYLKIIL